MSRSWKQPFVTLSKKWSKFAERSFRHRVKQALQGFDPDRDWEEINLSMKGDEDYGTRLGFDVPPDENEEEYKWYEKMQRK